MIKLYKILPFFLILFQNVSAQDILQNQYDYALNLYKEEKYFDAVTEFKRLIFFDTDKKFHFDANRYIGYSYKSGAKFSEALFYFNRAILNSSNNEEIFKLRIEIIRINILRRTIKPALLLLDDLEKNLSATGERKDQINYWRGWAYIFADDWEKASEYFSEIDSASQLKLIADEVVNKKYSVTLAQVLSYIIPGAGQFYTQNYISGILSLGWNVLFGYLTINSFIEERIFDGIMTANFLWLRFYRGNIQNAVKFAEEKNIEISNVALLYLQKDFNGLKP